MSFRHGGETLHIDIRVMKHIFNCSTASIELLVLLLLLLLHRMAPLFAKAQASPLSLSMIAKMSNTFAANILFNHCLFPQKGQLHAGDSFLSYFVTQKHISGV